MGINYCITFVNGKILRFEADNVEFEDGVYTFYLEGDVVAEFKRDNIAGYIVVEDDDFEEL